ncbi:hypothetical protein EMIT0P12_10359 [Pseudomonas sp. IT-P12]
MNIRCPVGHFWYARAVNTGIKRPISLAAASVVRGMSRQLHSDDRICRSTASTGLAALVKLRIEWISVKPACKESVQLIARWFLQMPIHGR